MPTADRYFSESPISGKEVLLSGSEAHHLIHVMRTKPGGRAIVFDGSGAEFSAQVEHVGRSDVRLNVLTRHEVDRELPVELVLGVALPKGDRQKWLIEKAVELGVSRIIPLRTSRSVAQPVEQALSRLQRSVIEASKQCGRNRLMSIIEPQVWPEFIASTKNTGYRLLAHPEGSSRGTKRTQSSGGWGDIGGDGPILLAVGPEGGFTNEEAALATAAGWRPVDLGPRILRIETAAILMVAMAVQSLMERAASGVASADFSRQTQRCE